MVVHTLTHPNIILSKLWSQISVNTVMVVDIQTHSIIILSKLWSQIFVNTVIVVDILTYPIPPNCGVRFLLIQLW